MKSTDRDDTAPHPSGLVARMAAGNIPRAASPPSDAGGGSDAVRSTCPLRNPTRRSRRFTDASSIALESLQ